MKAASCSVEIEISDVPEAGDALVEMSNRLLQGGDSSDERTESDFHIVKVGAHNVGDISECLEE